MRIFLEELSKRRVFILLPYYGFGFVKFSFRVPEKCRFDLIGLHHFLKRFQETKNAS